MSPTATAPAFSFSNLSIADAEVPKVAREKSVKDNPFSAIMRESHESGKGKMITIPAAAVPQAVYLLRSAASEQGIGSRIVLQDKSGNRLELGSEGGTSKVGANGKSRTVGGKAIITRQDGTKYTGNVNVLFQGKDAKQTKKRTANEQSAAASAPAA